MKMSLADNKTKELWQGFAPEINTIENKESSDLYSVEVYKDLNYFNHFNPKSEFEKWAAVPVRDTKTIPETMSVLTIPAGNYAVFLYKGKATEVGLAYTYILSKWLPNSGFCLDNRPHFAVMGEKYQNNSPESEEELWLPIKEKNS